MSITKPTINKLLSLLLVLSVVLAGLLPSTAVYASEVNTPGSAKSNAVLNSDGLIMDVTVPTNVLIYVDEHGEVTTPDYLPIINNSVAPVFVHSLTVTPQNGWTLDPIHMDYTNFKVNQKNYWLSFNGLDPSNGTIALATPINGSDSLNLVLSAGVAPQRTAINGLNIGEILITFDWDAAEDVQEPVIPPDTEDFTVGDVYHEYVDDYGDFVYIPLLTGGAGDYRVIIVAEGTDPETQALADELVYKESEESCTPGVPLPGYNPEQTYEVYVTYVDDEESETIIKVLSAKDTGGAGSGDDDSGSGDVPDGYTLATDDDFSGEYNGQFQYVGSDEYVVIPNVIKNIPVIAYSQMFNNQYVPTVKGVYSDNPNITTMCQMFAYYGATTPATELKLQLDMSSVTNTVQMFEGVRLTALDLSGLDVSNVEEMQYMFDSAEIYSLNLSGWDASKVTDMSWMFRGSKIPELDLTSFNAANVTGMNSMFREIETTTLDLSSFNTDKVKSMRSMFFKAKVPTLDLTNFNTDNVTDMSWMFASSTASTIDISSFRLADTQPDVSDMFKDAEATTVYVRSQADIDYIIANHGTDLPETLNFVIK